MLRLVGLSNPPDAAAFQRRNTEPEKRARPCADLQDSMPGDQLTTVEAVRPLAGVTVASNGGGYEGADLWPRMGWAWSCRRPGLAAPYVEPI